MILNMGPQHPATHGTLRLVARLDGEQVISADVMCGYMHRGYEKLCEVRTYPQVTTLVNRIDWLGSFANEVPFILAAEQLMEVEAPPRAQWIRTILFELSRIANVEPLHRRPRPPARRPDAGVLRLPRPRVRPQPDRGGHRRSLPPELRPHRRPQGRPAQGLDRRDQGRHGAPARLLRRDGGPRLRQRDLPDPHPRHRRHPRPTSPSPTACRAPTSAARGVDWDLRRDANVGLAYDELDWKVWTHPDGDSFSRCWVRLQEVREATKIVDQLLDGLPSGPIMAKVPRIIKVPEGEAYVETENPLGAMGYYVVSQGRHSARSG